MTEDDLKEFFGDKDVKEYVETLWGEVFVVVNSVIKLTKVFGFDEIGVIPNPSIDQMLLTLKVAKDMMDLVHILDQNGIIHIQDTRLLINAKQCLLNMESIADAVKDNNKDKYEDARVKLNNQAQI